ncbi:NAD(P)/FAD-dependent oxidoreductase [Aliiruegeria sabulilitoris]|uniref:NAD(P)/FAD-dependent oxidoreductase n=1 Tax=Aliiruegeria sabulilitoris TaxID=1510458 RepID=UPI000836BFBF|nr:FAD-binding oxidoreductase [Aliiruegeria sabulilitoris]NDR59076.1 FAD-binding oxidoreductase [Pseudoruegeria sp. M32A2M]
MDLLTANDRPGEYPGSYHASIARQLPPFPKAEGALRADVCIIGAGYTGLSAALHLRQRGYDVVVLEAQRVGFGASGRNGGHVTAGQRIEQDDLEAMMGKETAHKLWDIGNQAVDLVRTLSRDPAVETDFHDGIIHADHRARHVAHDHAYARKLQEEYGYDLIRPLDRDEMRHMVGSPAYHGGTLDMGSGHIDPLQFALGLARMAVSAGARIFEASKVKHIEEGAPARVRTESAEVTADHVILACNGYLGGLNAHVAARVMPINNFVATTEPMSPEEQESLIRDNHAVSDSKFVVNYFRFSDDHRLIFGGGESYGYRFPSDIRAKVMKPMLEIYPQLKGAKLSHAWGGTLAITMNRMPHFARLAGNILSFSGYSGHGLALGTLAGQIAAETIAGKAERFDVMASVPTPRFPGGAALRSPLLVLAMLWYSMRDKL